MKTIVQARNEDDAYDEGHRWFAAQPSRRSLSPLNDFAAAV
jgi:hypothetical protein